MRVVHHLLTSITSLTLVLGCLATLFMMMHVAADVSARLLIGRRVSGTLETVTYIYMVAVAFLPLATVQQRRQQITVEIFSHLLPRRTLALVDGTVGLAGCAFMLALAWYGAHEAWAQTMILETAPSALSPVPIWPARWFVVVSASVVAIHLAIQSLADLAHALTGESGGVSGYAASPERPDQIEAAGSGIRPPGALT